MSRVFLKFLSKWMLEFLKMVGAAMFAVGFLAGVVWVVVKTNHALWRPILSPQFTVLSMVLGIAIFVCGKRLDGLNGKPGPNE